MKLTAMLRGSVDRGPQDEALVYQDRRWTYAELLADCARAASVLDGAGVGEGDVVAAMTYNEPDFILAAFGAWMLGATFVPVNHKMQVPEVRYTVAHAGATVGVVSPELAAIAREAAPEVAWIESGTTTPDGFTTRVSAADQWEETHEDDSATAQILYTSGTTSSPKGCVHRHASLAQLAALISLSLGYERDERALIAMPIWHSAPLNIVMLPTLLLGGTVVLQREYHPVDTPALIAAERTTSFFGPTIAYLAPLKVLPSMGKSLADVDLTSMRRWIFGGSPVDEHQTRAIIGNYQPGSHYQVFGMTETGPSGCLLPPAKALEKAGSIGNAGMIGVRMRVVRADGTDAGPGETGEIWFLTDTVMQGYKDDPEATAAAFDGPWYKTGDIARVDEDGYFYIVDRIKDIIIVGGENVYSLEVEETIGTHPRVGDVAVVGRPDPDWGQQVVAHIVTTDGEDLSSDELREYLSDKLARYKIPREVVVVDELPRNPSGKLLKHVLRER